jgi:uncharacterized protein DUF3857/transglutaminase superfamily protein
MTIGRAVVAALISLGLTAAAHAAAPPPSWVMSAASQATPEAAKNARAVVLFDATDVTADVDGGLTTHVRRVVRILTPAGNAYAEAAVFWDQRSSVNSLHGWVLDGASVRDVREKEAIEATPIAWGELYNDSHVKMLRMPNAGPGAVAAYEYELHERPEALQTIWHFQEEIPVLSTRLTVTVPAGWKTQTHWFHHEPVDSKSAGQLVYELENVPAIESEPRMPPLAAVAGRAGVMIGTAAGGLQTWSDLGRWFGGLAEARSLPTPQIHAKVQELAPATLPAIDRIRALAEFVQREVRYVAIEIGIGGYQPHAASDVFLKRFGDCKDKVTLLRTMLRDAGIESHYVILNADRGIVDPDFPTPYTFNHAIIAIRVPQADGLYTTLDHPRAGKLLFFDPTSESTPFGTLPGSEQQGRGLLVLPDGGELVAIPSAPAQASQLRRKARLTLDANGVLSGEVEEVRTGTVAAEVRAELQPLNATERARWVDTAVVAHLTQAEVHDLSIENVDRSSADVIVRYHLVARDYITHAAGLSLIRPRVLGEKADAHIGARRQTYETGGPSLQTDDVEIAVAPVLTLSELPSPVAIRLAPMTYSSEATFDGKVLHYRREYNVQEHTVPLSGIEELNRAFAKIAAAERSTAVFVDAK